MKMLCQRAGWRQRTENQPVVLPILFASECNGCKTAYAAITSTDRGS